MNEFEKDAETKEMCSKDRELAEQVSITNYKYSIFCLLIYYTYEIV